MKIFEGKDGRHVTFEKTALSGLYVVTLKSGAGDIMDKVRCDDYRMAVEYRKAFLKAARTWK